MSTPLLGSFLVQLLFVMVITIVIVALCRRLKLPPIIGYIFSGILMGVIDQHSLQALSDLQVLAKYGVVFLLFSIGLEFSLPQLISMKKTVLQLGSLQMLLCGGTTYLICLQFNVSLETAFIIAVSIAMSSTAIISKILTETGDSLSTTGRLTMSILIFQDLMVIPAVIITGFFAYKSNGHSSVISALFVELMKGMMTFFVLVTVGKKVLTPIFTEIARARSPELFTLATLFIVLAAACFSNIMGMSYEFGAFLAGAMIGGTPYQHQVEGDIRPFQDVLLGLFFIGVGTLIDLPLLANFFFVILLIAVVVCVGKFLLVSYLVRWVSLGSAREATRTGLLLAQAGEFGFVLLTLALQKHFIQPLHAQILLSSMILSMLFSMLSLRFQNRFLDPLSYFLFRVKPALPENLGEVQAESGSIVIAGFGRIGQWVAKAITAQGYRYIALDLDPNRVNQARLGGENVIYADASDSNILHSLHVGQARAVVLTFSDPLISFKVLQKIRLSHANLPVLVRAHDDRDIEPLLAAGATEVISDALEASLMISVHLMVSLGMELSQVIRWSEGLRQNRYKLLKGYFASEEETLMDGSSGSRIQQRALEILEGQFVEGQAIEDLPIEQYGVEIIAMRKNGIVGPAPSAQAKIQAGDVFIMAGLPENLDRFEWYLAHGG